ncbi:MAG: hypothetical protein JWN15_2387, partial [Firmicutes bacterium]|nr:hypothetical protein [Bacillota bacterium]
MLSRWVPQDRILRQAVKAFIAFILCLAIAGGL